MGGDQVYPDPSAESYRERTVAPYRAACADLQPFTADLFALPGNHDWYDGLHAFTELFCRRWQDYPGREGDDFGCWRTCQTRSYFALRLPHNWWLCGVDVQLDHRLNATQLDYFHNLSKRLMEQGDKIILCAALPSWVLEQRSVPGATRNLTDIAEIFEQNGAELKLVLSGDLHHYSHYVPKDAGPHLVTAGGGGSFAHPTHQLPEEVSVSWRDGRREDYRFQTAYPARDTSRALSWRNLLFPFMNWEFSVLIGGVYALLVWFLETRRLSSQQDIGESLRQLMEAHLSLHSTLIRFFETIPKSPEFAIVVLAMIGGLIAFNVSSSLRSRILLGIGHALLHFVVLVGCYCLTVEIVGRAALPVDIPFFGLLIFLAIMVAAGALFGGLVFGGFLLFSLNVMNVQWTNAFSSLRIEDYKNFLRLEIDKMGGLTVYPVGVERPDKGAAPIEPAFKVQ